jgi:hypothetical protein
MVAPQDFPVGTQIVTSSPPPFLATELTHANHGFHDAAHKIESKTATHLAIRILSTKKRVKDLIQFPAG